MAGPPVILYRYDNSAFSTRVEAHLLLRDIKYKQCVGIHSTAKPSFSFQLTLYPDATAHHAPA